MPPKSPRYGIDPLNCTGNSTVCPVVASIYGYEPDLPSTIFFTVLFGATGVANLYLGIKYKTWTYLLAMCLSSASMTIGYIGRILLSYNAFNVAGFQIQICSLTLGPAFNSAAIYLILKHLTLVFGPKHSRIRPMLYTWIFISADFGALILQGSGGGRASTATNFDELDIGDDLLITGIAWQVATLIVFAIAAIDYFMHRFNNLAHYPLSDYAQATLKSTRFRAYIISYLVAFFMVLLRCVYRVAEMSGGWQNSIMRNEILFIMLESVTVSIASLCQTIFHPGIFFPALTTKDLDGEPHVAEKDLAATLTGEQASQVLE